jgi:hypothetical protein
MRRRTFHMCAAAALAALLAPAGCAKSDTILLITISGPRVSARTGLDLVPFQFRATITAGIDTKSIDVPREPHPSPFPQSFSVALDRSHTGPITVSIVALSEFQQEIASGTTTQQHIVIGGQTVIAVALSETVSPDDRDGGTDASDAGTGQDASDANDAQQDAKQDAPADKADLGADQAGDGFGLDTGTD